MNRRVIRATALTSAALICGSGSWLGLGAVSGSDAHASPPGGLAGLWDISLVPTTGAGAAGWAAGSEQSGANLLLGTTDGSTWSPQTVPSGTARLGAVSASSAANGWALGSSDSGSVILQTSDGHDWSSQPVPGGNATLLDISTVRGGHAGWAVGTVCKQSTTCTGSEGRMYHTTDGSTWTGQTLPAGVSSVTSVSAVDTTHAFAVGAGDCQSSCGSVLLVTTDGSTWTGQRAPNGASPPDVAAADATHAWAVGFPILATKDGSTWSAESSGGGHFVAAVDADHAFASSPGSTSLGTTSYQGGVAATTDGSSWTARPIPNGFNSFGITATSPSTVWVVAASPCGDPAILASSDGGSTWHDQLSQQPYLVSLNAVSFARASTAGWAIGRDSCGADGVVMATTDGINWTPQAVLPTNLYTVSAGDPTHAWVGGFDDNGNGTSGAIYATTDGATWHPATLPSGSADIFFGGLAAVDATHAWALAGQTIIATRDGSTWTAQDSLSTLPTGIAASDANHAWVSGHCQTDAHSCSHQMEATSDGGHTWAAQTIPPNMCSLVGVSASSAASVWAVASAVDCATPSDPDIMHTNDGGTNWAAETSPFVLGELRAVAAADATHAWSVGRQGSLIATSDGSTWIAQSVPADTGDLNGIAASTNMDAWAVGANNNSSLAQILHTDNGGSTWATESFTYPAASSVAYSRPSSLGSGPLGSAPQAVSSRPGVVDVFWRGTDDNLWHDWLVNGDWYGPEALTANHNLTGDPAAVVTQAGVIDVFWKGSDNNLWHKWYLNGWSGPENLHDGPLGSTPQAVSWGGGRVDVFWKGTDAGLWHAYYSGEWNGPEGLGCGPLGGQPYPVATSAGTLNVGGVLRVVWKGADNNLWSATRSGGWSGPADLGDGPLGSDPRPIGASPGTADFFWRGTNDGLYYDNGNGNSFVWLGVVDVSAPPAPASVANGNLDLYWEGTDANLWHLAMTAPTAQQNPRPQSLGSGPLGSPPVATTSGGGATEIFWLGRDGNLWHEFTGPSG